MCTLFGHMSEFFIFLIMKKSEKHVTLSLRVTQVIILSYVGF